MGKSHSNNNEEYNYLREEIMHHKKRQNTFTTFAYTSVIAILGYAYQKESPWIVLIGLVIILPTSFRVFESRHAIARIATYITEFIEPYSNIKWESNLHIYREKNKSIIRKAAYLFSKCDFVFLSLSLSASFWIMAEIWNKNLKIVPMHLAIFIQIIVVVAEIVIVLCSFDYGRLENTEKSKWKIEGITHETEVVEFTM